MLQPLFMKFFKATNPVGLLTPFWEIRSQTVLLKIAKFSQWNLIIYLLYVHKNFSVSYFNGFLIQVKFQFY